MNTKSSRKKSRDWPAVQDLRLCTLPLPMSCRWYYGNMVSWYPPFLCFCFCGIMETWYGTIMRLRYQCLPSCDHGSCYEKPSYDKPSNSPLFVHVMFNQELKPGWLPGPCLQGGRCPRPRQLAEALAGGATERFKPKPNSKLNPLRARVLR